MAGIKTRQGELGARMPAWAPEIVVRYLLHTVHGMSIRALARTTGCHASTILRNVRKIEQRREDLLVDSALRTFEAFITHSTDHEVNPNMTAPVRRPQPPATDREFDAEAARILRRLSETGAYVAVAPDLENAVVMKDTPQGDAARIAVVARSIVEAFALKDWVARKSADRVATYRITPAGKTALKQQLGEGEQAASGFAEAQAPFAAQAITIPARDDTGADSARGPRHVPVESPLALLARRRDKDGQPFLSAGLVSAGERLREDFELAQMGPRVTQNWEKFLTAGCHGPGAPATDGGGPADARERVAAALSDLGPGLGDVALRCCCFLAGMEAAERRMGWSARSGKIVLRIALQRLQRHYAQTYGPGGGMIG